MSKLTDKQALELWRRYNEGLAKDIDVDESLSRYDIDKKRAELEADPIAWILYFFPTYAKYEFAPFQVKAIRRIIANEEWYEVLSWSRELAKSTVAMFVIMYLTLTKRKRFVALASATIDAAERLLAPYKINFEKNPRLQQFYGKQEVLGMWTDREFSCACGAKFIALGAGSAPRGMRNEAIRPDILYFDDYDTDEDCRNPVTLDKKWQWAEHALYPTRSISEPTLVLWCGNIIAKDCCITRAGKLANSWDIVNIRDKHGRSTWPQKNTDEQIDRILAKISVRAQQAEYFNNPIAEGKIFKNLPFGKVPSLKKFRFLIGYGDPAYSDSKKKGSSTKALWLIGKYKGVYYIIKGFLAHETNARFIGWYFELDKYVAVAEMRSYLNKKYDCDKIFSARGTDRHALVLMFALDITIFHIFCQHNPYKMSKIRQDRYDRAVEWLKGVMRGDVTIDGAPLLPADELEDKSRWQIKADEVRPVLG